MSGHEITAEFEVADIAKAVPLEKLCTISFGAKTDVGRVRENNEDKYEFYLSEAEEDLAARGHIFVVCDGMGGHEAGQIASEQSCKRFIQTYLQHPSVDASVAARDAVLAANRAVQDVARANPKWSGMGCTLTAMMVIQDKVVFGHVGDSRAYRLRAGELVQLTNDHTYIEEAVKSGLLTREQAENHPYKHMVTRAIGIDGMLDVDVIADELQSGDVYLLCSDGLTNHVGDEEIAKLLSEAPSKACWDLVQAAMDDGGSDNTTVVIVRIDDIADVSSLGGSDAP